jgi:hypothetical protein
MPAHLELDFSGMRRAAFGRRQTETGWQIPHEISGDRYEARREIGAKDLKEELFEARTALPDDFLFFLDRKEI